MKFVIVFAALVAVCAAVPVALGPEAGAEILFTQRNKDPANAYDFQFETSNGISRQELGKLQAAAEDDVVVVNGVVSWTPPDGNKITLKFIANENGYQPQFEGLPGPDA